MQPEIDIAQVLLSFLLVLGLVGLFALALKKYAARGGLMSLKREGARIQVLENCPLDARRRVVLFSCDAKEYLAVLSPDAHTLIEHKQP